MDSILEQFEKEQAQEFGKPRQPKPEKPPSERKPRKRKPKSPPPLLLEEENDVEVETLRSGRKRKVRRIMTHFIEGSDEDDRLGKILVMNYQFTAGFARLHIYNGRHLKYKSKKN